MSKTIKLYIHTANRRQRLTVDLRRWIFDRRNGEQIWFGQTFLPKLEAWVQAQSNMNLNTCRALCIKSQRIDQHSLLGSINFMTICGLREVDFLSTRLPRNPKVIRSYINLADHTYSTAHIQKYPRKRFNKFSSIPRLDFLISYANNGRIEVVIQ
jgi:hypothetical protein